MITVSVTKKPGLTASFERSFDDANEAARFAESWLPMHVRVTDAGNEIDVSSFLYSVRRKESALRPFENADGSDETCPFCDAPETPILADDELLHACGVCDRCWYVDEEENVLPADRCPTCDSDLITVFDDGRRLCGACGRKFFFDGCSYVDPATVETESAGEPC